MLPLAPSVMVRPLVLVVDDETRVREVIRKYLEQAQFRVLDAEDGRQALALVHTRAPDLIVLDVMLPEIDGLTITQQLRALGDGNRLAEIPIILLTARGDEMYRVLGFELGADDYVVKPFSPRELVGRVKAVLRRSSVLESRPAAVIAFGSYRLNPVSRTLTSDQGQIPLTRLDFDLLYFLASHPDQVFTHEQILDSVWAHSADVDRGVVTAHIYRLREKIEIDPDNPAWLHTVWGVGYRFQDQAP